MTRDELLEERDRLAQEDHAKFFEDYADVPCFKRGFDAAVELMERELEQTVTKYRQIKLANTEISRNDHVEFGKLLEENAKLQILSESYRAKLQSLVTLIDVNNLAHSPSALMALQRALNEARALLESEGK